MRKLHTLARRAGLGMVAVGLVLGALSAASTPAWAQDTQIGATTTPVQEVRVSVGRSTLIKPAWAAKRVSVTDPKIADIQVLSPNQVLVSGKAVGTTDIFIWNQDEQAQQLHVEVTIDRAALKADLAKLFPGSTLDVQQSRDVLTIAGVLARVEQAQQLHQYMLAANLKYLDLTSVAGVQQVQIRVVVAEASRTAIRALGINAVLGGSSAFGGSTIGPDSGGALNPISVNPGGTVQHMNFNVASTVSPAVTLFGGVPSANLQVFIQALAENQYMRILAEPSLVALSGQEASFLAGGEFPIPVVQGGNSTGSGTSISIEYKEFGVRLKFRPTVLGDGAIRLQVAPEVSQLSNGPGSVQIQGFSIPALLTRRAETTLELNNGQTFAIAGLINQSVESRTSRVPGLGDLPILGALFRSVRYQTGDTELVVLVTADLVEPMNSVRHLVTPGTVHVRPNDWELYAMGQIEGRIPPKLAPADARFLQEAGLDRLKGAGAWATFDAPAVASRAPIQSTKITDGAPPAPVPTPTPDEVMPTDEPASDTP